MTKKPADISDLKEELVKIESHLANLDDGKRKVVKTLFRWQAFSRPYYRRGKKWFLYTSLLIATVILILLFVREFFVIAAVLGVAFFAYVLSSIPPDLVENEITTQGINSGNHSFIWDELGDFWFTEKDGFHILHIETTLSWPRRLFFLINGQDQAKIREILARYIPYRHLPKETWFDHMADWLAKFYRKFAG